MPAFNVQAIAILTTSLLASGCYCPMLSGRYSDLACMRGCPLPGANPAPIADPNAPPRPTMQPSAPQPSAPQSPGPQQPAPQQPAPLPPAINNQSSQNVPPALNSGDPGLHGPGLHGPGLHGRGIHGHGLLAGLGGRAVSLATARVPSQQGPDYASPQAKFHPIPTRPAFEPQFVYPPPQFIDPAGDNPLRPPGGFHSH
jgi:hypothetical protein